MESEKKLKCIDLIRLWDSKAFFTKVIELRALIPRTTKAVSSGENPTFKTLAKSLIEVDGFKLTYVNFVKKNR